MKFTKNNIKKLVVGASVLTLALSTVVGAGTSGNRGVLSVYADSTAEPEATATNMETDTAIYSKVVTLGADLNDQQRKMILKFFGVSDTDVTIVEVTNKDERKYLEGIIDDDIIGTRTFSCAYILPTNEGGIIVKTANLNWVTGDMIKNALLTSGITNCQVLATAPFEVSGTGALTGVFKAYEQSTGETLSEEKKELANEELATALDLSDNYGDEGTELLNEVKANVLLSDSDEITEEDIEKVVDEASQNKGVDLSDEDKGKVVKLMSSMSKQEYDTTQLQGSLGDYATNIIEEQRGIIDSIIKFFSDLFKAIGDFFSGLFGGTKKPETSGEPSVSPAPSVESIFDNIDDSEVKLDETSSPEEVQSSSSPEATVEVPLPEATEEVQVRPTPEFIEEVQPSPTLEEDLETSPREPELQTSPVPEVQ